MPRNKHSWAVWHPSIWAYLMIFTTESHTITCWQSSLIRSKVCNFRTLMATTWASISTTSTQCGPRLPVIGLGTISSGWNSRANETFRPGLITIILKTTSTIVSRQSACRDPRENWYLLKSFCKALHKRRCSWAFQRLVTLQSKTITFLDGASPQKAWHPNSISQVYHHSLKGIPSICTQGS